MSYIALASMTHDLWAFLEDLSIGPKPLNNLFSRKNKRENELTEKNNEERDA